MMVLWIEWPPRYPEVGGLNPSTGNLKSWLVDKSPCMHTKDDAITPYSVICWNPKKQHQEVPEHPYRLGSSLKTICKNQRIHHHLQTFGNQWLGMLWPIQPYLL